MFLIEYHPLKTQYGTYKQTYHSEGDWKASQHKKHNMSLEVTENN